MNKGKLTLIAAAVGTLLASAARVFVIAKTDMNTGLIVHGSEALCNILYFVPVLLTVAVCFVTWVRDPEADVSGLEGRGAVIIGFGLLVVAICAGYEGLSERAAVTPSGFLIFVDFLFAGMLCVIAFVTLFLKEFKPGLGFVYAFGGGFCVLRGINCFKDRMVVTAIPEYLIDCLITVGGAVFFLMLARLLSGNAGKLTRGALFGWGIGTAVVAASAYIGDGIAKLFLPSEISDRIVFSANQAEWFYQGLHGRDAYQLAFPSIADGAVGLFAFAALTAVCLAKKSDS